MRLKWPFWCQEPVATNMGWQSWVPTLQVPLSLSCDHRVIDGADGVRFITDLVAILVDMSADIFQVQTSIHSTE